MYIPGEGCTHTNLQTTFKEQSSKNLPNSRSNRAYSASEPHPIYNNVKREGKADSSPNRPSTAELKPENCKLRENI